MIASLACASSNELDITNPPENTALFRCPWKATFDAEYKIHFYGMPGEKSVWVKPKAFKRAEEATRDALRDEVEEKRESNAEDHTNKSSVPVPRGVERLLQSEAKPVRGKWQCPTCTFHNKGTDVCAMCGGKYAKPRGQWQCPRCTCVNEGTDDKCGACLGDYVNNPPKPEEHNHVQRESENECECRTTGNSGNCPACNKELFDFHGNEAKEVGERHHSRKVEQELKGNKAYGNAYSFGSRVRTGRLKREKKKTLVQHDDFKHLIVTLASGNVPEKDVTILVKNTKSGKTLSGKISKMGERDGEIKMDSPFAAKGLGLKGFVPGFKFTYCPDRMENPFVLTK